VSSTQILQEKYAVVFGAGGSIGAAVAKEFAAQGAELFLSGHTKPGVESVTKQIAANGGRAHATVIDTLDDAAVNQYIDDIAKQVGKVDIILDAAGPLAKEYGNGKNAVDLPIEEFMVPLATMLKSRFITARAAARLMIKQHSGVIIFVTGSPARAHVPGATAIGAAFGAIENLTQNLAFEISPFGVRVVCLRTLANTDSRSIGHDVLAGRQTEPHKGLGDGTNRAVQLSEGPRDGPGYGECTGADRFRPRAHADGNGGQRDGGSRAGLNGRLSDSGNCRKPTREMEKRSTDSIS